MLSLGELSQLIAMIERLGRPVSQQDAEFLITASPSSRNSWMINELPTNWSQL